MSPQDRAVSGGRALALVIVLATWGCGSGADQDGVDRQGGGPLMVLAASSLARALDAAIPVYEASTDEQVAVVFGSSGNLAAQIRNGAPADLFLSADQAFLDELVSEGRIAPASRVEVAVGRLALVVPYGRPPPDGLESLADPSYRVVAIANPEHAPYGVAARAALQAAGVWSALEDRVVMGENVGQTLQYVRTGNAEAGLVSLSLVLPDDSGVGALLPYVLVDSGLHRPIVQVGGVLTRTSREGRASAFLEWLTGSEGAEHLRRFGLEAPRS